MKNRNANVVFATLASVAALVITGCKATTPLIAGLPPDAKFVGKGEGFRFELPSDGEMFAVRDGKVEHMSPMRKGSTYEAIGPAPGSDLTKSFSDFEYYFHPRLMPPSEFKQYK